MKKAIWAIVFGSFFLLSPTAHAVFINFDDIPTYGGWAPWTGNRYQALGVTFSTDGLELLAFGGGGYTNTLPNYVYGSSWQGGLPYADRKVIATFSSPVNYVQFYLADAEIGEGAQWYAQVFDGADNLLGSISGNTNDEIPITFYSDTPQIAKLVFSPSTDREGIDSLTFYSVPSVPEPSIMLLLGSALLGLLGLKRKF